MAMNELTCIQTHIDNTNATHTPIYQCTYDLLLKSTENFRPEICMGDHKVERLNLSGFFVVVEIFNEDMGTADSLTLVSGT